MPLKKNDFIELPSHINAAEGFDHADVDTTIGCLYVAHTANHTIDVINCSQHQYLRSISDLCGVAGVLVSEVHNFIFTSNRDEDTISILTSNTEQAGYKISVGCRPNGLAFDPKRQALLVAHVGDPLIKDSYTVDIINVEAKQKTSTIAVPGRTRWAMYDAATDAFYVNISSPAKIAVISSASPNRLAALYDVPADGPHGLGIDSKRNRLFCACDQKILVTLSSINGEILNQLTLNGKPDTVFYNQKLQHLYISHGDEGIIDVVDTSAMRIIETVETEKGSHTMAFDASTNEIYAFLPRSHGAFVFTDR